MSGFVHTPMTLPPVAFGTDPTGSIAVQILGGGGGGGATTIIALLDTPGAYGTAGQVLAVNSGRTGMEFVDQAGGGFDGAFASLTGLPTTLAGYGITDAAGISHTQSIASITGLSAQLTALSDAIDTKAAASHTHAIGDTTGLQAALDGKSPAGHTHAFSALTGLPTTLAGYGITDAAAASHVHSIAQITGLSGQLTALSDAIDTKAAASHTHAFSALTGIPTTLAGYGITDAAGISHTHAFSALTGIPTTLAGYGITDAAPISHTHPAGDLPAIKVVKSVTIPEPTASEDITLFFCERAVDASKIKAVVRGTTPSWTWTIRFAADRSATGTELVTGGTTTTSQTSGSEVTSFSNASIPAGSFVWIESTAASGTLEEAHITFEGAE